MSEPLTARDESRNLFERAGGLPAIHELVDRFYTTVLADPLLSPLFGAGSPKHVDHLTAWMAEVLGGPTRYSDELGGFPTLLHAHRGLRIRKEQADRFADLFMTAVDGTGLGRDAHLRKRLDAYVVFGVEVAVQNSYASAETDLHPCQVVPRWT